MKSNNSICTLDLSNISAIEEIGDFESENYTGGAFRFAVSSVGENVAREVTSVTSTTTRVPANSNDGRVKLNSINGGGIFFAIAIHDRNTGENLFQIRGENNPAITGELIDVTTPIGLTGIFGDDLEYRVRQFEGIVTIPPGNNTCPTDTLCSA